MESKPVYLRSVQEETGTSCEDLSLPLFLAFCRRPVHLMKQFMQKRPHLTEIVAVQDCKQSITYPFRPHWMCG